MADAGKILIIPKGIYSTTTAYEVLDLVNHKGKCWIAKKDAIGIEPSEANSEYWFEMAGQTVANGLNITEEGYVLDARQGKVLMDAIGSASAELAVERARIDSFVTLPEGSTAGDAELIDARIGADGVTYGNLGKANRTQFANLKSDLSESYSELKETLVNLDTTLVSEAESRQSVDTSLQNSITNEVNRAKAEEQRIEALFSAPTEEAVSKWLDEHPEATTTVQDSSLTESEMHPDFLPYIKKDYVTPEMFGAVGDGVTDDTTALQNAVDYCANNGGMLSLNSTKNYLITSTINITKKMVLDGNGGTITSTAPWAIYVYSENMWDGEFTIIQRLRLVCVNGIKIEAIRTQVLHSRIQNSEIAIQVLYGGYETIVDDCYLVSFTPLTSVGIVCETSDVHFTNITGYGQHIFIKNRGSSLYDKIHGWPIDSDYEGSIFFYELSSSWEANITNCYSDTYQYAFRSISSMNHLNGKIEHTTCNWSNKPEGWLFYAETETVAKWAFMKADLTMVSLPEIFHVCNHKGAFCFSHNDFILTNTDIIKGSNCYVDDAKMFISENILNLYLNGSVDTTYRTDLELYLPYCSYFTGGDIIPVVIDNKTYFGKVIQWGSEYGTLKVECTKGFTANSGYVRYAISTQLTLAHPTSFSDNV